MKSEQMRAPPSALWGAYEVAQRRLATLIRDLAPECVEETFAAFRLEPVTAGRAAQELRDYRETSQALTDVLRAEARLNAQRIITKARLDLDAARGELRDAIDRDGSHTDRVANAVLNGLSKPKGEGNVGS